MGYPAYDQLCLSETRTLCATDFNFLLIFKVAAPLKRLAASGVAGLSPRKLEHATKDLFVQTL